jgi:hypothetical protein
MVHHLPNPGLLAGKLRQGTEKKLFTWTANVQPPCHDVTVKMKMKRYLLDVWGGDFVVRRVQSQVMR